MSFPRKKFTKTDCAVFGALVLICAALLFGLFFPRKDADTFTVTTTDGTAAYSISDERTFEVESNGVTLVITVADGTVSVTSSTCPDHICEQTGRISRRGQSIVCIPARVVIEIVGGGESDEDFIVG